MNPKDMDTELKYEDAVAQLEALVTAIEDPKRDLSGISADVRKAMELVRWCKEYIRKGESEIGKLIEEDGED